MLFYLSAAAVMKNEGPYLREWLEYHRMVGVEHFYLYDNNSSDETLDIVAPYVAAGIVTLHHWPEHPLQLKAYMHCLKEYRQISFWIAFIDLDEFIVPVAAPTISDILRDFESYGALAVNWLIYGNSGHETRPSGLQIENYVYRSEASWKSNRHVKSIVNPRRTKAPRDPHCFRYLDGFGAVDENHQPVEGPLTATNSTNKIRINHYFTRSTEESRKKMERGNPDSKFKRPWNDFVRLNRNDVLDTIMQRYIPELKQRLASHLPGPVGFDPHQGF